MAITWKDEQSRRFCVYLLRDPEIGCVRYVGISASVQERLNGHLRWRKAFSNPVDRWTQRNIWRGSPPIAEVVARFATKEEAECVEQALIELYAKLYGPTLLNRRGNPVFRQVGRGGFVFVGEIKPRFERLSGWSITENFENVWLRKEPA